MEPWLALFALGAAGLVLLAAGGSTLAEHAPAAWAEAAGAPAVEDRIEQAATRARELAERRPELLDRHRDLYALALLQIEKARLVCKNYWAGIYRDMRARAYVEKAEELLDALAQDRDPALPQRGRIERAYLAPNDLSPQPYVLYVPESYDGSERYGLLVYLHGYSPDLNKENWVRYMYADVLDQYCTRARCILLMPFARSNTDFQGIGEDDVMLVLDKALRRYRIDPDRVILGGYSMGGMGVWTIGGHYPDRFAGLLAMSGRGDFYLWKGIRPEDLPGFKRKLAEQEFGANLLPNYAHLPAFLIHGSGDWGISVQQSRLMHRLLREAGLDVRYVELQGEDHFFFYRQTQCRPDLLDWLAARRRAEAPRKVSLRTYTLKYNRAYWVEILGIGDWGKPAELTCELSEDGGSLDVTLDGHGRVVLGNGGVGDAIALKTPELCGPVREAFAAPFVMAYGGEEKGAAHVRALQAAADWERFAKGTPRLVPADELEDEDAKDHNLILFGTPEDNPWIRKLMPHLPIKIQDGSYRVGERTYDATRFGLWLVYPNPFAPGRCVAINSGPAWGRDLPDNHKYDFIPDFIIYTDEKSQDGTECNKYVCAGFFDQFWGLDRRSTWYSDEPR